MDEAKKPVDGIEHIAKEAADKAQFDFNPAAWAAMEKKLNDADKAPFVWWKVLFPIGIIALILLFLLWPQGKKENVGGDELISPTEQVEQEESKNPGAPKTEEQNNGEQVSADEGQEAKTFEESKNPEEAEANAKVSVTEARGAVENETKPIVSPDEEGELASSAGSSLDHGGPVASDLFTIEFAKLPELHLSPKIFLGRPGVLVRKDSFGIIEEADTTMKRKGGAWIFMISGDLSGTSTSRLDRAGTMFGVLRESYLGKNWSLSFGAAYSIKNYSALGEEYETPWWALRDPDAVESILANCIVIDIPINVRRYFDTKKGNSFFVSSGLSSYFMLREDYEYIYNEDKPAWTNTWGVRNENKHFFGVLNLSIGYERPLTKNLRLNIEPFVKIPLSGIGAGKVDLLSFGIKAALKLNK